MTLFTFDDWYPSRSEGVHLSRNSNKKSCKSRITRLQNSKSRITLWCPIPRPALWPDSIFALSIFFFAWSRLHIARASGTERTTVIHLKDDGLWQRKRTWALVLSERSSNSVSVVRVVDQLFKCFKVLDWFSDTHLSDFFHSYNLWFKDFQHNF